MIHEARIYDKNGKLKQVISARTLTERFWADYKLEKGLSTDARQRYANKKVSKQLKKNFQRNFRQSERSFP